MDASRAFVKLDFVNAFYSIRRDAVLDTVARHIPSLLDLVASAYGAPASLWLGNEHQISSAEGVQQGDPLRSLLYASRWTDPLRRLSQSLCQVTSMM